MACSYRNDIMDGESFEIHNLSVRERKAVENAYKELDKMMSSRPKKELRELADHPYFKPPVNAVPTKEDIEYLIDFLKKNEKALTHIVVGGNHEASYRSSCVRHGE